VKSFTIGIAAAVPTGAAPPDTRHSSTISVGCRIDLKRKYLRRNRHVMNVDDPARNFWRAKSSAGPPLQAIRRARRRFVRLIYSAPMARSIASMTP
jgi:hypothetical protein